jgi:hypothetical protein
MPTFLVTSRMAPALAARVQASVTGRKRDPGASSRMRRIASLARLALVLVLVFATHTVVTTRQRMRADVEQRRANLLEAVRAHAATLTAEDQSAVARAERWLVRFSGAYEGDVVADEVRSREARKSTLGRPAIYVRGTIESLRTSDGIAAAAATSAKDALLLCLSDPPAERTEAALLERVRTAYGGGVAAEERSANVRRLDDAIVGLPFLLPPWADRVRAAEDANELARLKRDFERTPIERAKQAARAEILVAAADEPGDGSGPTELDGERPHDVRITIVDLRRGEVLLRMRRHVDPSWISAARRPMYATGLDGCAFAFDVHEALDR